MVGLITHELLRQMITYIVCGIFVFFAGLFIADSTIETVVLDKRINTLALDRYDIYCNNKHTRFVSNQKSTKSYSRGSTIFRECMQ